MVEKNLEAGRFKVLVILISLSVDSSELSLTN